MDALRCGDLVAISRYWTPDHLDVTHVPMTYARPKAAWLDALDKHRFLSPIDDQDRLFRRRLQTHAVVDPEEIPVLPALRVAPEPPEPVRVPFAASLRSLSRTFLRKLHAPPSDELKLSLP